MARQDHQEDRGTFKSSILEASSEVPSTSRLQINSRPKRNSKQKIFLNLSSL